MRYLLLFLILIGCGFKPSATCVPGDEKALIKSAKDCVRQPMLGITKEF